MIKKKLQMNDEAELKFRQERINGRPLVGFDHVFKKALPSWLSKQKKEKVE